MLLDVVPISMGGGGNGNVSSISSLWTISKSPLSEQSVCTDDRPLVLSSMEGGWDSNEWPIWLECWSECRLERLDPPLLRLPVSIDGLWLVPIPPAGDCESLPSLLAERRSGLCPRELALLRLDSSLPRLWAERWRELRELGPLRYDSSLPSLSAERRRGLWPRELGLLRFDSSLSPLWAALWCRRELRELGLLRYDPSLLERRWFRLTFSSSIIW